MITVHWYDIVVFCISYAAFNVIIDHVRHWIHYKRTGEKYVGYMKIYARKKHL